jgi:hypothetical protein
MTVSIYTRESKTRRYISADPKRTYPAGTTFYLRFTDTDGKRKWKPLSVANAGHAEVRGEADGSRLDAQGDRAP